VRQGCLADSFFMRFQLLSSAALTAITDRHLRQGWTWC